MHLTDSAVHQQLFLDVLNGTKVLVGDASWQFFNFPIAYLLCTMKSSISATACHHRFFRSCEIGLKQSLYPWVDELLINPYFVYVILVITEWACRESWLVPLMLWQLKNKTWSFGGSAWAGDFLSVLTCDYCNCNSCSISSQLLVPMSVSCLQLGSMLCTLLLILLKQWKR